MEVGGLKVRKKPCRKNMMIILILAALGFATFFPFFWMVLSSLKRNNEVFAMPFRWLPESFQWQNYISIWEQINLATFFRNTTFLTLIITSIQLFTSSFAAYGFSKMQFKGRDLLFLAYIATIAVPWQVYMIPQFILMSNIGLTDNLWALILLQSFNAFGVFLMKQYYESIPDALCESARIDGLNEWGIYFKIMLPLIKPAIASLTIITFVNTWNDYMGPLLYLTSMDNLTIQVGIRAFIGLFSASHAYIMAASVVSIIPVAIVFICLQKYFIEGIATSGMKG